MEDIIERSLLGEASDAELAQLAAWRDASADNEQEYQQLVRLLAVTRRMRLDEATSAASERPRASDIIALAAARQRSARPLKRLAPWAIAAAASLVAFVSLARDASVPRGQPMEVVTGASELATVQLGDGSVVRLAPSSRLQLASTGSGREVTIEGRAFFAVQKQRGQPFRVRTRLGTAQVLGTRFELATVGDGLRLLVVEGRVALDAPRNRVEVGAGEQSAVRDGSAAAPTKLSEAVASWVGKFVVFRATPLREAAREIERVYGIPVTLADSTIGDETVTATLTDKPLAEAIGVLCSVLDARCTVSARGVSIGR